MFLHITQVSLLFLFSNDFTLRKYFVLQYFIDVVSTLRYKYNAWITRSIVSKILETAHASPVW